MKKNFNISFADDSHQSQWDQYVLRHPKGLPYHLFAWKKAVEKAYRFKGWYFIARDENRVRGVFPLVCHHAPLSSGSLVSLPYCDAAGPLADSPVIETQLLKSAFSIARDKGIQKITIRSAFPLADYDTRKTVNSEKVRMVLPLGKDSDTLLSGFKAKLRSQVKKPLRDGLTARIGGAELAEQFYPLFAENMRDLGSPVHSRRWIKSVLQEFGNRAHLVIVNMPDGAAAAGGIILTCGGLVSVPWASSLRKYNRWNPNMLLYWTFLKYAADMGYAFFDFGRSTVNEGTFRFKKQWGAGPLPLHWAEFDASGSQYKAREGLSGKRDLAARVIMKTPVPAATALGTALRKYISL